MYTERFLFYLTACIHVYTMKIIVVIGHVLLTFLFVYYHQSVQLSLKTSTHLFYLCLQVYFYVLYNFIQTTFNT